MLTNDEKKIIVEVDLCKMVNAQVLSYKLNLSEKTVYRKIKKINDIFLNEYNCKIIDSIKGKGFAINKDFSKIELSKILNTEHINLSIFETVAISLIECAPYESSITKLFDKFYLSESSINRIIKRLENSLIAYDLELSRSANFVKVSGLEPDLRRYLQNLYIMILNKNSYLTFDNNELKLNRYKEQIEEIINYIETEIATSIIEPYYTNMYIYIHVLLRRYKQGQVNLQQDYNQFNASYKLDKINIRSIANNVIEMLSSVSHRQVLKEEVDNLCILILSSRMTNVNHSMNEQFIKQITNEYIYRFLGDDCPPSKHLHILYSNLKSHVGPMIFRNENQVEVINHLTEDIKSTYSKTYQSILEISNIIASEYQLNKIPDDEIAYITLYFEEYLLQVHRKLKIIITCLSGIGTSSLLKMKLERTLDDIEVVGTNVSHKLDIHQNQLKNIDLVISTTNIDSYNINVPIVYINPLLSDDDLSNLKKVIKEVRDGRGN